MPLKSGLAVVLDRTAEMFAALETLTTTRVMVGVPDEKAGRREKGDPINNAALLYIHDKGAPEANIPARPSMKPGIEAVQAQIETEFATAGKLALSKGGAKAAEAVFHRVGIIAQNSIKAKISEGIPPPLAPSTVKGRLYRIKGRKRRNRIKGQLDTLPASRQGGVEGVFTPLIVTAQMLRAITHVLRKDKGAKKLSRRP